MKHRYAAHYVYLSGCGYLKKHGIEVIDGHVTRIFSLVEEIEDTEWLPGVIALLEEPLDGDAIPVYLNAVPSDLERRFSSLRVYHFFPFDFTLMRPVSETLRRQLP